MNKLDEIPLYRVFHFFNNLSESFFFNSKSQHNVVLIRLNRYIPAIKKVVPLVFLKRKGIADLEPVKHTTLKRFEMNYLLLKIDYVN